MSISLVIFLYLYFLFLLVWAVFSVIALYHVIKYGQISFSSFFATLIYLAVSALIFYVSFAYLSQIDWSREVINLGNFNFFGLNNF